MFNRHGCVDLFTRNGTKQVAGLSLHQQFLGGDAVGGVDGGDIGAFG